MSEENLRTAVAIVKTRAGVPDEQVFLYGGYVTDIEKALDAAYERGAVEMREKVIKTIQRTKFRVDYNFADIKDYFTERISALPLRPEASEKERT